jgi:hypothetical protein
LESPLFLEEQYTLDTESQNLLEAYALLPHNYTTCYGTQIQQILHTEFITIIQRITLYHASYATSDLERLVVEFADLGIHANKAAYVTKAITCADVCFGILECCKGSVEGIGDG